MYPPASGYSQGTGYGMPRYGTGGNVSGTSSTYGAGMSSTSRAQSGSYTPNSQFGQGTDVDNIGTYDPGSQGIDVREVRP